MNEKLNQLCKAYLDGMLSASELRGHAIALFCDMSDNDITTFAFNFADSEPIQDFVAEKEA